MSTTKGLPIQEHFSSLTDTRQAHKTAHLLEDMIILTICAVMCGADTWVAVETFGRSRLAWLKTFLSLPNGIPSHDTLGRVFSLLDSKELEVCFQSWVTAVSGEIKGVVAIDGKTIRHSFDTASGKSPIHLISAWASETGLIVGQLKTDDKSNEITAIPELLQSLFLKGCIVTIDAMGCQKKIAEQIVSQEADYVLSLKRNQEGLYDEVHAIFQMAHETNFEGMEWSGFETEDKGHGRHEKRRYWTIPTPDGLKRAQEWSQLNTIGMVEYECHIPGKEATLEHRFYITSLKSDAEQFAKAVRSHWRIENSVHWILDVAFREDDSRIRIGNAAENFSLIRRLVLNLLKRDKSSKIGTQTKRQRASWDEKYFWKVLGN